MIYQEMDNIKFKMKEQFDFEFIHKYGTVFKVFDDQDSGNIGFGVENGRGRFFVKFAGAKTAEYKGKPADAVERLKATLPIPRAKSLIQKCLRKQFQEQVGISCKWLLNNQLHNTKPIRGSLLIGFLCFVLQFK